MEYLLAIDVGGSSIKYAVMDREAHVITNGSFKSDNRDLPRFLDSWDTHFLPIIADYKISGIAVSTCGAVNRNTGVIEGWSALPFIHGPNMRELISQRYQLPCEMENDACCAALAEVWKGAAEGKTECCLVVLGTGIGGAVIQGGKLQHGHHLHGGEFGYMVPSFDGQNVPPTFSDLASTRGLIEHAERAIGVDKGTLTGLEVFRRYDDGDEAMQRVVLDWFRNVTILLYNIQYAVDPEMIVIGGAASARPDLLDNINQQMDALLALRPKSKIRPSIAICDAGNDANLIGAVYNFLYC